jgi:hypothetical protein
MVLLFWALKRFQVIHMGDMGAVGWALGIFDRGERKTGSKTYLKKRKADNSKIATGVA